MIKHKKIILSLFIAFISIFLISGCSSGTTTNASASGNTLSTTTSEKRMNGETSSQGTNPGDLSSTKIFKVTKIVGNEITGVIGKTNAEEESHGMGINLIFSEETESYIIPVGINISGLRGANASLSDITADTLLRIKFNENNTTLIELVQIMSSQNRTSTAPNAEGALSRPEGGMPLGGQRPGN